MSGNPETSLFRVEAISAKSTNGLGSIRMAQPVSYAVISMMALAISIAIVLFATLSSYTKKAHIAGVTVPRGGIILINSLYAGRVNKVLVGEGQHVHAGDKLIEVASEREIGRGEASDLVAGQLNTKSGSLDREEQVLQSQREERDAGVAEQMRSIERQISEVNNELSISKRKLSLTINSVENYQRLFAEGYMPSLLVKQKQEEALDGEARISSLVRTKIDLQANYSNMRAQRRALANTLISDLLQIKKSRAVLRQEAIENDSKKSNYLVAPRESIVSTINIQPGQSVLPSQSVVTLIPVDTAKNCIYDSAQTSKPLNCVNQMPELFVQLFAPSRTAGFIANGQNVLIRIDAFPYQKFGFQHGEVIDVSRTPLAATELPSTLAAGLLTRTRALSGSDSEALYRINVKLKSQDISLYGKRHALKPGLMLEADVLLDKRKVWEWLFEPALAMGAGN